MEAAVAHQLKFTLVRDVLLSALQLVSGVVERRQTLPILGNVLFSVSNQQLSITGTDSEVELSASIPVEACLDQGKITVPARKSMDICRSLPEASLLNLKLEKQVLNISSGSSCFSLACLPATEFPLAPAIQDATHLHLASQDILKSFASTRFAMAQQDVRYFLNGSLLHIENGTTTVVSTDGHRLALSKLSVLVDSAIDKKVIIPRKAVLELIRLLGNTEEELQISLDNNHICFRGLGFSMVSKLVDGRFPDYHRVIPKHNDKTLKIDRDVLKQALSRVAILANEKHRGVRIDLSENSLTLLANNPEREQAQDIIAVDYQAGAISIGFNVSYLLDILSVLPAGQTEWLFSNGSGSVVLCSTLGRHENTYVVMPMRL